MHGLVQPALPMVWRIAFEVRDKQTRNSMMRWLAICWMSSAGKVVIIHSPFRGGGASMLGIVSFAHSYILESVSVRQRGREFKFFNRDSKDRLQYLNRDRPF